MNSTSMNNMPINTPYVWKSHSVDQTRQLGRTLAPFLKPNDVFILSGDLGAGKTHFVQGVAEGLHIKDDVTSPTFDLITTYSRGRLTLNHADLYRLDHPDQLDDIGYWDALESGAVNFIEWGNRFADAIPEEHIELQFTVLPNGTRIITALPHGARYEQLARAWHHATESLGVKEQKDTPVSQQPNDSAHPEAPSIELDYAGEVKPDEVKPAILGNAGTTLPQLHSDLSKDYILAMDTSNESVAIGLGKLDPQTKTVTTAASVHFHTHRASNEQLLPQVDMLMRRAGIERGQIRAVAGGRGPGSFTGVRICLSTAKGIASALHVALVGVSTMDAVAYRLFEQGKRGQTLVLADAMRKEVYPVRYLIDDEGIHRQNDDTVIKAALESEMLHAQLKQNNADGDVAAGEKADGASGIVSSGTDTSKTDTSKTDPSKPSGVLTTGGILTTGDVLITGDALVKYMDLFGDLGQVADKELWVASGASLLACVQDEWQRGLIDPFDVDRHDPSLLLPVYTRLSDAEENEKARAHNSESRDLRTGVQHEGERVDAPVASATSSKQVAGMDLWIDQQQNVDRGNEDEHGERTAQLGQAVQNEQSSQTVQAGQSERPAQTTPPVASSAQEIPHTIRPLILAIESSCDETGAAIVDGNGDIVSDVVASQIDFHARFGGVVPEIASRKHIEAICGVTQTCLERAATHLHVDHLSWRDLDAVGVTYAPGLVGGLVVGVAFAKGASWAAGIPCIAVNHLEGHMYANRITHPDLKPPFVASLISGGNTMLVHVRDWGSYHVMGQTLDDAVGEAFDKVSKALGLGYPGGPIISKLAAKGNPRAIHFPRAMMHSGDLRFSLSGLKTAVITYIEKQKRAGKELNLPDIAASFEAAVVDVQVSKAQHAIQMTGVHDFCVGGGVAANPQLRQAYEKMCKRMGVRLTMPPASACTDNASMIGLVALTRFRQHKFMPLDGDAYARADLNKPY